MSDFIKDMLVLDALDKQNDPDGKNGSTGGEILLLPFLVIAVFLITYPALLYWQYRRKSWISMAVTVALLPISIFLLLPYARFSFWEHLGIIEAAVGTVALLAYLHVLLCKWLNKKIANNAPITLSVWAFIVFVSLTISFASLLAEVRFPGYALTSFIDGIIHGMFNFQLGYMAQITYDSTIKWAFIASPAVIFATLLQAWFRRRADQGKRTVPWYLIIPTIPSIGFIVIIGILAIKNSIAH